MKELLDRESVWKANSEPLKGKIFIGDFIFHRASLYEFELLLAEAQAGLRDGAEVIAFIDPWSRTPLSDSTTLFGLGHQIDQNLRLISDMGLTGSDREAQIELFRQVAVARENILRALGEKDPHIWGRNRLTGELEHLEFAEKYLGDEDVVDGYRLAVTALFDHFENLFGPADVIARCEMCIKRIEKYLAGGMNIRINQPLTDGEIEMQNRLLLGYQAAVERSKARL